MAADGALIVVDHIRPLRKHWHLRLDPANLQVLCSDCNMGKSNSDVTDWRTTP
jgi:5-methylcytosine-specific restriction endonuclease McrA